MTFALIWLGFFFFFCLLEWLGRSEEDKRYESEEEKKARLLRYQKWLNE